jgi:acyl carrier protein
MSEHTPIEHIPIGRIPVEAIVLDILAEVLNESVDDLCAHPILATHGWDSLASLEALAQFEHRFAVTLDLRSFHAARTVEEMVVLVEDAVGARSVPAGDGSPPETLVR